MLFLWPMLANASQVVLQNDVEYADSYSASDQVTWLAYPDCAIAVLTPDAADYPIDITSVVFLGSSTGSQSGVTTATVGLQFEDDRKPSAKQAQYRLLAAEPNPKGPKALTNSSWLAVVSRLPLAKSAPAVPSPSTVQRSNFRP